MKLYWLLLIVGMGVSFSSCGDDYDFEEQKIIDEQIIQEYIVNNGLTTETTGSGLHYIIIDEGDGQHPNATSVVSVQYTGTLTDGSLFDSSRGNVVTFGLNMVIPGWTEGIPLLGRGGMGKLIIPSHLGYGPNAVGSIPSSSVLIFDVELVDF